MLAKRSSGIALLILFASASIAQEPTKQGAKQSLKDCVDAVVDAKAPSNASEVLTACNDELNAFMATLSHDQSHGMLKAVNGYIDAKLK